MVKHHKPCTAGDACLDRVYQAACLRDRQGDVGLDEPCTGPIADVADRLAHGAIGVRRGEYLVVRAELNHGSNSFETRKSKCRLGFFRRKSLTRFSAASYNLGLFGRGVEQSGSSSGS